MFNKDMYELGNNRSVIRELFEYGKLRAAEVGPENVYDFSIGNPSVPAPAAVNETAARLLREQPDLIHAYTSAQGAADARERAKGVGLNLHAAEKENYSACNSSYSGKDLKPSP